MKNWIAFALFFYSVILGCKKSNVVNTPPNSNTYVNNLYYTGTPIIGDTIFFHTNPPVLPNGTNYLWDFGDGITSASAAPYHIYNSAGNFNVTLTINNISQNPGLGLVIPIYKDPVYTRQMTNLRMWHGLRTFRYLNGGSSTNTTLNDSSFALQYTNEATIFYAGSFFTYNPSLSSNDIIAFSAPGADAFLNNFFYNTIYYNHLIDSAEILLLYEGSSPGSAPTATTVEWHSF